MQTLVFNTTTKEVTLWSELPKNTTSEVLDKWVNIITVKIENGYYEVIQKDESGKVFPIFRCPIANTNMIINR